MWPRALLVGSIAYRDRFYSPPTERPPNGVRRLAPDEATVPRADHLPPDNPLAVSRFGIEVAVDVRNVFPGPAVDNAIYVVIIGIEAIGTWAAIQAVMAATGEDPVVATLPAQDIVPIFAQNVTLGIAVDNCVVTGTAFDGRAAFVGEQHELIIPVAETGREDVIELRGGSARTEHAVWT